MDESETFRFIPWNFSSSYIPSHLNLKDDFPKKISYLSKFINALSQNRLVRSTEIYKAFFSLPQEEFENKKKEIDKIQKPKALSQFSNMEGVIELKISKELDTEALHLPKTINKKIDLFKNLDTHLMLCFPQWKK